MRELLLPILATALTAACAGLAVAEAAPAPAQPVAHAVQAPSAPSAASLTDIAGEWDIVSFDGLSPGRAAAGGFRHYYLDVHGHGMRFSIGCNFFTMPVRIEAGVLHRAPGFSSGTEKGCGSEAEALDRAFVDFFSSAPKASLLPDGRLRMSAPGHELLLERASAARRVTLPGPGADEPAFSILMPQDLELQPVESDPVRIFKGGGIWFRFGLGWDLPGCPTQTTCRKREIIAGREARSVTVDVSMPGALYNKRSFYQITSSDGGGTFIDMMCAEAACPRAEAIVRTIRFAP